MVKEAEAFRRDAGNFYRDAQCHEQYPIKEKPMATHIPHCQIVNDRERVIASLEAWAEPYTQCIHRQAEIISMKLAEGRHLVVFTPLQNEPIVVLMLGQIDSSGQDNQFPDRFVAWLREGGDDPMPDAVYAPHLNALAYGITIPVVDWPTIETQYLPMIDFVFGLLAQLQRFFQAVRTLDLEGEYARGLRDRFHSEAFIRREAWRASPTLMYQSLATQ